MLVNKIARQGEGAFHIKKFYSIFNNFEFQVSVKSVKNKPTKATTSKPEVSAQTGNGNKTSFDNDVTIIDEFGFIGKSSFHVKKVSLELLK